MSTLKRSYKKNPIKIGLVFGIFLLFIGVSIIPSTGKIISENKIITVRDTIDGLYYLRDDDPLNWADVGSLLKSLPVENELTLCGMFINFHFAQPGDYIGTNTILNIYYHFWQKVYVPVEFEIGYSTSSNHTAGFNESIWIDTNNYICEIDNYRLIQVIQYTNPEIAVFEDDEIYNFTIKFFGPNPNVLCNPDQYSFIILNLEDNETLMTLDSDGDLLSDFDELFVYYTNPYDSDTDNDGFSDYEESIFGTDPNNNAEFPEQNNPPNKPIISGPTSGKIGISYNYNFVVTDADEDNIFLWIDWGDGQLEEWIGPYESNEVVTEMHTWTEQGKFTIRFKAKDILNAESEWGTLEVTMPRNKATNNVVFWKFLEHFPLLERFLFLLIN